MNKNADIFEMRRSSHVFDQRSKWYAWNGMIFLDWKIPLHRIAVNPSGSSGGGGGCDGNGETHWFYSSQRNVTRQLAGGDGPPTARPNGNFIIISNRLENGIFFNATFSIEITPFSQKYHAATMNHCLKNHWHTFQLRIVHTILDV